jgi:hypothetical protein
MYWHLGTNITACIAAGRVMFLDIALDRYFAAPPAINDGLARWLGDRTALAGAPEVEAFLAQICGPDGDEAGCLAPTPREVAMPSPFDARLDSLGRIRPAALASIALRVCRAQRDLRRKPLGAVLADRLAPGRFPSSPDPALLRHRLRAFHAARPLVPVPRICLHDCLALLDWLGEARAGTQLLFGVAAYPFAAHSWVQWQDEVIDGHPESVSRFTPIRCFP